MATHKWASAHDWLRDMRSEGHITDDELVDFLLNIVDNDQIQDRFQSFMDDMGYFKDEDDSDMRHCPNCQTDVNESDFDEEMNLCNECATDPLEAENEAEEPRVYAWEDDRYIEDPLAWNPTTETNGNTIWLRDSDHDYDYTTDRDYPPFGL